MSRLFLSVLLLGPGFFLGSVLLVVEPAGSATSAPYAEHPPLRHTGGFGEPTCHACHFGGELNAGAGQLSLEGLPSTVQPGETYRLRVLLRADMARSGFMGAVRFSDGTQAGALTPVDTTRVAVETVDSTGVQYAYHTLAGTEVTGASATWAVRWTAPEQGPTDSVVVHGAANAANGDASAFGDDVYSTQERVVLQSH